LAAETDSEYRNIRLNCPTNQDLLTLEIRVLILFVDTLGAPQNNQAAVSTWGIGYPLMKIRSQAGILNAFLLEAIGHETQMIGLGMLKH